VGTGTPEGQPAGQPAQCRGADGRVRTVQGGDDPRVDVPGQVLAVRAGTPESQPADETGAGRGRGCLCAGGRGAGGTGVGGTGIGGTCTRGRGLHGDGTRTGGLGRTAGHGRRGHGPQRHGAHGTGPGGSRAVRGRAVGGRAVGPRARAARDAVGAIEHVDQAGQRLRGIASGEVGGHAGRGGRGGLLAAHVASSKSVTAAGEGAAVKGKPRERGAVRPPSGTPARSRVTEPLCRPSQSGTDPSFTPCTNRQAAAPEREIRP